jgi:hypothetical protein
MPALLYEFRHTYPCPPIGGASPWVEASVVYLRLRIVSITLTSKVPDVLDVFDVLVVLDVAGGGGSDLPVVGISPAKIDVDSAHISTTAIASCFMGCLAPVGPLDVEKDAMILT